MKRWTMETLVGLFVVVGIASLAYLAIKLGKLEVVGSRGDTVLAEFDSVAGLKNGSVVEIAGVEVGRVRGIGLKNYRAVVRRQASGRRDRVDQDQRANRREVREDHPGGLRQAGPAGRQAPGHRGSRGHGAAHLELYLRQTVDGTSRN